MQYMRHNVYHKNKTKTQMTYIVFLTTQNRCLDYYKLVMPLLSYL